MHLATRSDPDGMYGTLNTGAIVLILIVVVPIILAVLAVAWGRHKENQALKQGEDPMYHIGRITVRPSSVKAGLMAWWLDRHFR